MEAGRPYKLWDTQPVLPSHLEWVKDAFDELQKSRPVGWSIGSIPFEAIDRMAERLEVEDFDEFRALIRAADDAWLTAFNEKTKKRPEKPDDPGGSESTTRRPRSRGRLSPGGS